MQVDDATSEISVGFLNYFDLEPQTFAWRDAIPHTIESRRSLLSDLLFFDTLLLSGGVREPATLYPPTGVSSLSTLLHAIENSNYDRLKKDSLVYFLLKWHQDGREVRFADERCISPQFCALCDAYWHLDTGWNVERAVSILSDARLNRDYASKIIEVISLSDNPTPLIVKYVRTCKPLLTEPDDIDIYALSLAETSFLEAWQYQRSFSENDETRPRVLRKLLNWTLSRKNLTLEPTQSF
ncbi:hypothetical protein BDM02DRAFT_1590206 [Thelephora ganbajun]|uniref:Uncharacterized protein n=1 Tax=Thelephora ganbajun TaxID=370292 RepID=A0ACB6ZVB9_THEGA|nr:hypothetical protein BDM02DRAFT_1590206 [Thelephora ganbajun]